jgi:hypothetical protein
MDFAGPLFMSEDHSWITVVMDKVTKMAWIDPSLTTDKAPDTARQFFDNIVMLHGLPLHITPDRDAKFTSLFWMTIWEAFGTKLSMSSAYHPQHQSKTVMTMLSHYLSHNQQDWLLQLTALEFAYYNSINPSTNYTLLSLNWDTILPAHSKRGLFCKISKLQTTSCNNSWQAFP